MTSISTTSSPVTLDSFTCPGHDKFFHHYSIYDKAKKKAQEEVDALVAKNNNGVESATYRVIEKDSIEGKESGFFNGLNRIYKYFVTHTYFHENGSFNCPHIRDEYANALAKRSLVCSPKELGDIVQKAEEMSEKIKSL